MKEVVSCLECEHLGSIECKDCYRVIDVYGVYGIYTKFKSVYPEKGKVKSIDDMSIWED